MSKAKRVAVVTSALLVSIALILGLTLVAGHDKPVTPTQGTGDSQAASSPNLDELANLVNDDRVKAGVTPLTRDPALDLAAQDKCKDMVTYNYWDHYSPTGVRGISFIENHEQGLYYGENLSAKGSTATDVNNGWMGSPGHRENILRTRFDSVGYAICDVNVTHVPKEGSTLLGLYKNVIVQFFIDKN